MAGQISDWRAMTFISTRGQSSPASLREALLAGLAPDGGLYVPAQISALSARTLRHLRERSVADVAAAIGALLFGDEIPSPRLEALLRDALTFDTPLVPVADHVWALELFHGPTLAFKDVGARVMARLMAFFHAESDPLTILVATSGDTGGAVAHAFFGAAAARVVVLYPSGQVSEVQEAQFTTLGGNVTAVAVSGSFDDCQRLVKEAFASSMLRSRVRLTSANSINIGRLLPQAIYYVHAALQFPSGQPPVVSVPSGNFGNLAAGLFARAMGAPIARFVAATTVNDTGPRYLQTGRVEPKPSTPTLASAMDVGNPSNLERIRWLFGDRVEDLRRVVSARVYTDDEVRSAMRTVHDETGYVCDPHSAIAWLGLQAERNGEPGIFLSTAHPAKFREVVEPAIGRAVPLPLSLATALDRPRHVERISPHLDELIPLLT
jgi:threonine synthase